MKLLVILIASVLTMVACGDKPNFYRGESTVAARVQVEASLVRCKQSAAEGGGWSGWMLFPFAHASGRPSPPQECEQVLKTRILSVDPRWPSHAAPYSLPTAGVVYLQPDSSAAFFEEGTVATCTLKATHSGPPPPRWGRLMACVVELR